MTDTLDPLVRDLVEWIVKEPRPYRDVIDAWRTSCPRLTVWEDAADRGYVERVSNGHGAYVIATEAGRKFVESYGQTSCRQARSARSARTSP